jgi:hypothetical protein
MLHVIASHSWAEAATTVSIVCETADVAIEPLCVRMENPTLPVRATTDYYIDNCSHYNSQYKLPNCYHSTDCQTALTLRALQREATK